MQFSHILFGTLSLLCLCNCSALKTQKLASSTEFSQEVGLDAIFRFLNLLLDSETSETPYFKGLIDSMLKRGWGIDQRDLNGETMLIRGIVTNQGSLLLVQDLISKGAVVDEEVISHVVMCERIEIAKFFLDSNLVTLQMKAHAIIYAIEMHSSKSFELFINSVDDINLVSAFTQTTPLIIATLVLNVYFVSKLLEKNADSNARDSKGRTALHNAVETGSTFVNLELSEILFNSGADPHLATVSSMSPLDLALEKGYDHFINLFERCELVNKVKQSILDESNVKIKNEPTSKASDTEIDNENSIAVGSSQCVVKVEGYELIDLIDDHFTDNFLNVMKPSADYSPEEDQAIRAIYYKKDCESAESDGELVGFGDFEKSDEHEGFKFADKSNGFENSEESDDFEIVENFSSF